MSAAVVGLCVVVMRHTIVAADDWNFVLDRRGGQPSLISGSVDQWIQPHNGHPVMILIGIYRLVGALANYNYQVLVGVAALVHVALAAAVYRYAQRRLGAWAALVPAILVVLLGRGAPIVLSPIVMAFTLALLAGITALNLTDRWAEADLAADPKAGTRFRRALLHTGLGLFALMSSGLGVARVVTIGMDQVLRARRSTTVLRSVLRSVLISGLPLAAFVLWYVNIRDETRSTTALGGSASFGIRVLTNGVAGFFGLGTRWSTPVGVLFTGALMAIVVIRWRHIDRYRLGALIVGIIIDVVLVSWARAGTALPASGRYVYVFGLQAALVMIEALSGWRVPPIHRRVAAVVAIGATAAAVIGGAGTFLSITNEFRANNHRTQISLSAFLSAQRSGVTFGPDFQPDPEFAPQVSAARLNGLVADGRSPVGRSIPRLQTDDERGIADFFDATTMLSVAAAPAAESFRTADRSFDFSSEVPPIVDEQNVRMQTRGACTSIVPTGGSAFVDVVVPLTATTWFIIPRAGTAGTPGTPGTAVAAVAAAAAGTARTTSMLAVRARQRGSAYASRPIVSLVTSATGSVKGVFADRSATANARPWILRIEPTIPTDLCADD